MERLINIILSELSLDNMKIQDELEKQINASDDLESKLFNIKKLLKELILNEASITKFKELTTPKTDG